MNLNIRNSVFFIAFSLSAHGSIFAQSQILDNYVEEGLQGNNMLKQQQYETEKTILAINIARSKLFPRISFNPNYTLAAGGRKLEFPIGDLLNPVYNTLNKLTQSGSFPEVANEEIQFLPNNFHETKVSFQLPLFNSDIKYNIELQKEQLESNLARKKTLEHELKYNIHAAYFQYLQSLEAVKSYQQAHSFLKEYKDFNQKLVDNKVALKDVIYASEYELSKIESQIIDASKNTRIAQAYFNFLINRPLEDSILIDVQFFDKLPYQITLDNARQAALKSRPELAELESGKSMNNTLIKMQTKNANLPTFFLAGNLGFQGYGYTFKNQAFGLAQAGMNWEIFNAKEKKKKIEQSKIQTLVLDSKTQELKNNINMQTTQAWYSLDAALKNLEKTEHALLLSEKLLEMTNKKYKNQNTLYIEVLKVQNDRLLAALQVSLARFTIWLKKAELDKAAGI